MNGEQVKVKYGVVEAMRMVTRKLFTAPLPIEAAYWLKRNVESVAIAVKGYDEKRTDLIKQYGILEAEHLKSQLEALPNDGTETNQKIREDFEKRLAEIEKTGEINYHIEPTNEAFNKAFTELMETEVEATVNKIELSKLASVKLTVNELSIIEFMICENKAPNLIKIPGGEIKTH